MPRIARKQPKRAVPHATKEQRRARKDFASRLLDGGATKREVLAALQVKPEVDQATGKRKGGLGITEGQARRAYRDAVLARGEEFREEQTVARSEQAARLRAAISVLTREKRYAQAARYEQLYANLFGTFAPTRIRVEADDRAGAIARALAGRTDGEIEALAAGEGGGEGEDE